MFAATYAVDGSDAGRIEIRELPAPEPGPGEVRVRVAVSGVNPTDWKARKGGRMERLDARFIIPNQDGAGTIDAVGAEVDPRRIGERVWLYEAQWGRAHGTAAELIALPAEQAVALPDGCSFELAASLGIPAITAHRCLAVGGVGTPGRGAPGPGSRVLVTGGAGAVGHAAIELARWMGAEVAATVSTEEKAEIARKAGAALVVNYREEDVAEAVRAWAPEGVERIVDVAIAQNLATDAEVLASRGVVVSYAAGGPPVELSRALMALNAELEFVLVYTIPPSAKRAAVDAISAALRDGALTTLPLHRFALAETQSAHEAVESGAVGKVLIDVA